MRGDRRAMQAALALGKSAIQPLGVTDDLPFQVEVAPLRPVGGRLAGRNLGRLRVDRGSQGRMTILQEPRVGLGNDMGVILRPPADHALHHVQPHLQPRGVNLVGHLFQSRQPVGKLPWVGLIAWRALVPEELDAAKTALGELDHLVDVLLAQSADHEIRGKSLRRPLDPHVR